MDSRRDVRTALTAVLAGALSGVAFYLSTGFSPPWWVPWIAALPVLWVSTRLPWWAAALAAFLARGLGGLSLWHYARQVIQLPLAVAIETLLLPAVAFSLAVLLFRFFLKRRQEACAVIAFSSLMVACEYLSSLASGTFGNTAYTQLDNVLVLQTASLAGIWGISFLVLLLAPLLIAIAASRGPKRWALSIAFVVIFGGVCGYGAWRLWVIPPGTSFVRVGLAETETPQFPQTDQEAMQLMRSYAEQVRLLALKGAEVVVLPEMTAAVHDSISGTIDELFRETARASNVRILLGVLHVTPGGSFNEARVYSSLPKAAPTPVYRKQHLIPVLEGGTTPGKSTVVLSQAGSKVGLMICRDMDYADPADQYARDSVGLVLVPAWDMGVDRWWHGHMALMRGVENGFSIARTAKNGFLTVSDDRGRVLAERATSASRDFTTLLTAVPVRHDSTLYQRWGDWFAWLDLACLAFLLPACFGSRQAGYARAAALLTPTG
jgi:apolipoprotein N-acyltransferase